MDRIESFGDWMRRAFLRLWGLNMLVATARGNQWPGFHYSDEELDELRKASEDLSGNEVLLALGIVVTSTLVIIVTGVAVPAVLDAHFHPTPSAAGFASIMAGAALAFITMLPISIHLTGYVIDRRAGRGAKPETLPIDTVRRLHRKALRQLFGMTTVCVLLIAAMVPLMSLMNGEQTDTLRTIFAIAAPSVGALTLLWLGSARRQG